MVGALLILDDALVMSELLGTIDSLNCTFDGTSVCAELGDTVGGEGLLLGLLDGAFVGGAKIVVVSKHSSDTVQLLPSTQKNR